MTINYSQADLKKIAAISADSHISLLTNCGINGRAASKIIAMDTETILTALAQVEGIANRPAAMDAMIAASRRELLIRQ